jgi:protein-S-isoprenylcysteine O-methyltransferase Ste14
LNGKLSDGIGAFRICHPPLTGTTIETCTGTSDLWRTVEFRFEGMMSQPDTADHPKVIAPPPLIYGGALAAGFGLDLLVPLPVLAPGTGLLPGLVSVGLALALAGWCIGLFIRAKTEVPPHRPTSAIVTDGPYRFSRNPIYVALTLLSAGIALWVNSFWMLGLLIPTLVVMTIAVIGPEEQYLERKFGAEYLDFKSRVRRWI